MGESIIPATKPEPIDEALGVLRVSNELREPEFLRLFFAGPRHLRFNQVECARAAGYGTPDSSDETLRVTASRILHQPRNLLRLRRTVDRLHGGVDRQIEELSRMAFAKASDYVQWDGAGVTVKPSNELDDDQLAAVVGVVEHRGKDGTVESVEVKLADKIAAQRMLAWLNRLVYDNGVGVGSGYGADPDTGEPGAFTLVLGRNVEIHHHHNGGPATNGDGPPAPPTSGEEERP